MLNFLMFMNLTIHDTKRFTIHNISSPIHYLYFDYTTINPTAKYFLITYVCVYIYLYGSHCSTEDRTEDYFPDFRNKFLRRSLVPHFAALV